MYSLKLKKSLLLLLLGWQQQKKLRVDESFPAARIKDRGVEINRKVCATVTKRKTIVDFHFGKKKEEENGGGNFHLLLRDPYSIVLYLRMELVGEGKSY